LKTILSKKDILELIQREPPLIEDYIKLEDQLQPNGFDLTLREAAGIQSQGKIGVTNSSRVLSDLSPLPFRGEEFLFLGPGSYVVTYNEIVHLPKKVMALGAPRSSLLRCGVTVGMAVWDAGYSGRSQSLLTVHNPLGFQIQKNSRLAQLVFFELADETEGYNGAYQNENIKQSLIE
jgi:dUTP pyrophosphatase